MISFFYFFIHIMVAAVPYKSIKNYGYFKN